MAELSAELTAEIKGLQKALAEARKEFAKTDDSAEATKKKIKGVGDPKNVKSIDSTTGSVKSLGLSLLGSAVGVTTLAGALTFGITKLIEYATELTDAEKIQRAFTEATSRGIGAATAEITTLNTLINIARDQTRSIQSRQTAINKLNEEYKQYLPNLTTENINTKKVLSAVNDLTTGLIRQAKIRGAQNLIAKETANILKLQEKSLLKEASTLDVIVGGLKGIGNAAGPAFNVIAESGKTAGKEITESERRIKSFTETLQNLLKEDIDLGGVFTSSKGKKGAEEEFKNTFVNLDNVFKAGEIKIKGRFDRFSQIFSKPFPVAPFKAGLSEIEIALKEFNTRASIVINEGLVNTFAGIGEAIGGAVVNGGNVLNALGASLLSSAGGIATQLGTIAIGIGIGLESIKTALKTLQGPVAIAAGVALVALGSAFKAGAANLSKSFSGGGGSIGGGTLSGGSSFTSSGGFTGGASEVVFRISGTDLIGVLQKAGARNTRLGGNFNIGG